MKLRGLPLLVLVGASALVIRLLLDSEFAHGTLLYLVVPFVISIALYAFTSDNSRQGAGWRYLNHLRFATIIFLATSALLFEGFLCVMMFMPIYYAMVSIGYLFVWLRERRSNDGDVFRVYAIPSLIVLLASEGLVPATTLPREGTATYTAIANQSVGELQANMAAPIVFSEQRPWFLSLFPLPDRIEAGTLGVGDVHHLHFTYKKWFLANFHQGVMDIRIAEVSPSHIRTEITRNTAYLSHYMQVHGTDVRFTPLVGGRTRVSLTVKYRRLLDPAWYFGPMQQAAAEQSARYLVESIVIRQSEGAADGA